MPVPARTPFLCIARAGTSCQPLLQSQDRGEGVSFLGVATCAGAHGTVCLLMFFVSADAMELDLATTSLSVHEHAHVHMHMPKNMCFNMCTYINLYNVHTSP